MNKTQINIPVNLGYLPKEQAKSSPDATAIITFDKTHQSAISYAEFEASCDRVCHALHALRIPVGSRVVLRMLNSEKFLAVLFGALRAGLIAVPIDPNVSARKLLDIIKGVQPGLIVEDPASETIPPYDTRIASMNVTVPRIDWNTLESTRLGSARTEVDVSNAFPETAVIMYTSGSSGTPKGIQLSHKAALSQLRQTTQHARLRLLNTRKMRSFIPLPLSHEAAFSLLKITLGLGGVVGLEKHFSAAGFLQNLKRFDATNTVIVPTIARAMLTVTKRNGSHGLRNLSIVAIGGAPCSESLLSDLETMLPSSIVSQYYGLTECGNVFERRPHKGKNPPKSSLGIPAGNVQVKIGHDNTNNIGTLYIKSDSMMSGYIESKQSHQFSGESEWLNTRDIFMRDENGFYYYKGRADDMFTFKGKNVYPAEIENALMDHPDIACAVVFPVKDVMRENLAIAAVEPTGDADLTEADVKDIHRNSNGDLPRLTRVIVLPKIPLLSNGKPDLHRLRTLANHCQQQSNSR